MSSKTTKICITPTRNEAWIANSFVAAANVWADHIIVADQNSIDGTRQALEGAPNVTVVANDAPGYDERHRQNLLLQHAREVAGKRIIIALDADEALSANCIATEEWKGLADAAPGTVLRFRWVNILPGFEEAWIPPNRSVFGFVDDGSEHDGTRIHSRRVPWPKDAPVLDFNDIVVLHFQYVAWDRMISKHRWYQAWEHAEHQEKSALEIFRCYHHMNGSWDPSEIHQLPPEWLEGYDQRGINFRKLKSESVTWWDKEVLQMLRSRGAEDFRKIAIWDKDWNQTAKEIGWAEQGFSDPRSLLERISHRLLAKTQQSRERFSVRGLEFLLRKLGW